MSLENLSTRQVVYILLGIAAAITAGLIVADTMGVLPMFPNFNPILLILLVGGYFLPTLIAAKKQNLGIIFLLNLALGWTGIVWLVCLALAVLSPIDPEKV